MVAERTYSYVPTYRVLRDANDDARIKRLTFHIEQGDYFPFLATIIGFLKETLETCERTANENMPAQAAFAEEVRKDLLYLQEHYRITPLEKAIPYTKKKMVRF